MRTFHALGREILIDAGVDVSRLLDRAHVLGAMLGRPPSPALLRRLDDAFSRMKLDPDGAEAIEPDVRAAFDRYQAWLAANRALDFDDLVARAQTTLRRDEALLERWRGRCATLLVDEVQDLDRTQLDLALLLAGSARDLFMVGDDDQTIYAWRLADVRRILRLADALPGLRRVDLTVNHRCPREVVQRSVRLIDHGVERFAKVIQPGPAAAGRLVLAPDPGDPVARARALLRAWALREEGTYAVLARTNAELAPVAAAALERGVAYRADPDGSLLDEPEVDAILDALRPAPDDLLTAIADVLRTFSPRERRVGRSLLAWAASARDVASFKTIIREARERRHALRRDDARLILATVHGTKGLEFDHVAVIGLDEGTFPSDRTLSESTDPVRALEEERRLAYVAWTRARRSLLLVYDPGAPSVFMQEAFDTAELQSAA